MNSKLVWGMKCRTCKSDVFVLQEESHPWFAAETVYKVKCDQCGSINRIDQNEAEQYFNHKIYEIYDHVAGNVVDFGCGGGFIANYLDSKSKIKNIYAIDSDASSKDSLSSSGKIQFIQGDLEEIDKLLEEVRIDYMVSRDVVMYLEDLPVFIEKISQLVDKGIVILGWYNPALSRVKNTTHPEEIKEILVEQGFSVEYEELNWYKWGYSIKANR